MKKSLIIKTLFTALAMFVGNEASAQNCEAKLTGHFLEDSSFVFEDQSIYDPSHVIRSTFYAKPPVFSLHYYGTDGSTQYRPLHDYKDVVLPNRNFVIPKAKYFENSFYVLEDLTSGCVDTIQIPLRYAPIRCSGSIGLHHGTLNPDEREVGFLFTILDQPATYDFYFEDLNTPVPPTQGRPGVYENNRVNVNEWYTTKVDIETPNCNVTWYSTIQTENLQRKFSPEFNFLRDGLEVQFERLYDTIGINTVWDFGDGITSTLAEPTHVYQTPGVYDVCVEVDSNTSVNNKYGKVCRQITVRKDCKADFILKEDSNANNSYVGINSSYGEGNITYTWDFGDGTTLNGATPSHQYTNPGDYLMCLTIQSDNGCSDTFCDTISFDTSGGPQLVNIQQTTSVSDADTVTADYTYEVSNISTGEIEFTSLSTGNNLGYHWSYREVGNTSWFMFSSDENPTYEFPNDGSYEVKLEAYNLYDLDQFIDIVEVQAWCVADFHLVQDSANMYQYWGYNNSHGVSGQNISYAWDFGDGSPIDTNAHPTHQYNNGGQEYVICLTIISGPCIETHCDTIFVPQKGMVTTINFDLSTMSIDENEESMSSLKVFPNPFQYELTLSELNPNHEYTLQLFTTDGREVSRDEVLNQHSSSMYTGELSKGIYLLHVVNNTNGTREVRQIVKK